MLALGSFDFVQNEDPIGLLKDHTASMAEAAKSIDPKKVAEQMHSGMQFKTVLGDYAYDKKGDITKIDYVMYIWKKDPSGKISYVECPASGCSM